jgi:hypothetical protein
MAEAAAVNVQDLASRVDRLERELAEHRSALQEHGHFREGDAAEEVPGSTGKEATAGNKPRRR